MSYSNSSLDIKHLSFIEFGDDVKIDDKKLKKHLNKYPKKLQTLLAPLQATIDHIIIASDQSSSINLVSPQKSYLLPG